MRKLMIAAAVAAIATVGHVGRADAQAPARVQGAYGGSPSQYPAYPQQQYPSTSRAHHKHKHDVRNRRDGDDDDQGRWGDARDHDRGRHNGFDHSRHYGYDAKTNGFPSRVGEVDSGSRARARRGDGRADDRYDRDWRDRR